MQKTELAEDRVEVDGPDEDDDDDSDDPLADLQKIEDELIEDG